MPVEYIVNTTTNLEIRGRESAAKVGAKIAEIIKIPEPYDAPLAADQLARRDDVDAVKIFKCHHH